MCDLNALSRFVYNQSKCIFILMGGMSCIMWQSDLAACGHVGVATRAGGVLFVTRRDTCVRACSGSCQLSVINRQRRTCLNLSV